MLQRRLQMSATKAKLEDFCTSRNRAEKIFCSQREAANLQQTLSPKYCRLSGLTHMRGRLLKSATTVSTSVSVIASAVKPSVELPELRNRYAYMNNQDSKDSSYLAILACDSTVIDPAEDLEEFCMLAKC